MVTFNDDGLIKNNDSNEIKGAELIGTNFIVTVNNGEVEESFRVVVAGDVNGDAQIKPSDYVSIKNYIMGTTTLEGAYKIAADVNHDGEIKPSDYVKIKNYIMGTGTIE